MSAMSESGKTPFVFLAKLRDQFVSFGQKAADGFRTPVALNALFAGAYTFVGFIVALTPIIWLVSHFSRSTVPVPIAARGALALLWSALGGTTRVTTSAGDIPGSTEWQAALAIRPTFLSILFLFVAAWVLKRVIKAHASSTINPGWVATAFGVGVAVTGGLGALFGGGAVDWNDQTIARVMAPRWVDLVVVAMVVILPVLWLSLRGQSRGSSGAASGWGWSRVSLATFAKVYAVVVTVALATYFIVNIIRPQFITSSESPQPLIDFSWDRVVAPIGLVILFLPTLVAYVLFYFAGVSVGGSGLGTFDSETWSDSAKSFLNDVTDPFGSASLFDGNTLPAFLIVLAVLCALGAGGWAAIKTNYQPQWLSDSRRILVTTLIAGAVLLLVTQQRVGWTNNGVPAREAVNGQIALASGFVRVGLGAGALALMSFALMLLSLISAIALREFLADGLPRLTGRVTGDKPVRTGERKASLVLGGRVVTTLLVLAVALPLAGAIFERAWALADGPGKVVKSGIVALDSGDVKAIQEQFGFKTDRKQWFSTSTLRRAMSDWTPGKSDQDLVTLESRYSLNNSHNRDWKLGELDAVGIPSWTLDDKTSQTQLSLQGTVRDRFKVLRHADYAWTTSPLAVNVSAGPFYPAALATGILINGNKTGPGTFFGVPGFYRVSARPYGVIARTDQTFYFNGSELDIQVGTQGNVPKRIENQVTALLGKTQRACENVNKELKSQCLKGGELFSEKSIVSGVRDVPDYDTYDISKVSSQSLKCDSDSSRVTSSVSVLYSRPCNQDVNFTVTYIKDAITEPIYQTRSYQTYVTDGYDLVDTCPDLPYYCYDNVPYGHYETRSRQVVVGQRVLEPRKTYVTNYTSSVEYSIRAQAALQKNKTFAVSKVG